MALNTVYIDNISDSEQTFTDSVGTVRIAPHRRAVMTYKRFTQLMLGNVGDPIYGNPLVKVTKVREVPTFVNVTEFGARGDGLADDTRAFQRALDYLEANGGGVLDIPAGIYNVADLSIKAPTTFDGIGRKTCIINHISDGTLFTFDSTGTSELNGLSIYGSGGTTIRTVNDIDGLEERLRTDLPDGTVVYSSPDEEALSTLEQTIALDGVTIDISSFSKVISLDIHSHIRGSYGEGGGNQHKVEFSYLSYGDGSLWYDDLTTEVPETVVAILGGELYYGSQDDVASAGGALLAIRMTSDNFIYYDDGQ